MQNRGEGTSGSGSISSEELNTLKAAIIAQNDIISEQNKTIADLKNDVYTKTEVNNSYVGKNDVYTKEQTDELLRDNAIGVVGQNWTLLKELRSDSFSTTLTNSIFKWGASNETVESLDQFKFIALQNYRDGYGTYAINIVPLSEFKKYNSYTNFFGLHCDQNALYYAVYYCSDTSVRFRVIEWF